MPVRCWCILVISTLLASHLLAEQRDREEQLVRFTLATMKSYPEIEYKMGGTKGRTLLILVPNYSLASEVYNSVDTLAKNWGKAGGEAIDFIVDNNSGQRKFASATVRSDWIRHDRERLKEIEEEQKEQEEKNKIKMHEELVAKAKADEEQKKQLLKTKEETYEDEKIYRRDLKNLDEKDQSWVVNGLLNVAIPGSSQVLRQGNYWALLFPAVIAGGIYGAWYEEEVVAKQPPFDTSTSIKTSHTILVLTGCVYLWSLADSIFETSRWNDDVEAERKKIKNKIQWLEHMRIEIDGNLKKIPSVHVDINF